MLSKGLKFVLPLKKLSFDKHLLTFEKFYRSISMFTMSSDDIIDSQIFKDFEKRKKQLLRIYPRTIVSSLLALIKAMEWSG